MKNLSKLNICQGDIWFVDLDPVEGHEQGKKRPCVVISPNLINQGSSDLAVVIPITSKFKRIIWYVDIPTDETMLPLKSYVICNHIRTVSHDRFSGKCLGTISPQTRKRIDKNLKTLLDIY